MGVPSQRKYDKIHNANLDRYAYKVKKAYLKAVKEVASITYNLKLNDNNEFFFRNNKEVNRKINQVLKELYNDIYGTTASGILTEWDLAVEKNNELAQWVFGKKITEIPIQIKTKYFTNNSEARKAFVERKINGLNLSDRVWNLTQQFKEELELSLELGIGKGKSADQLARSVRQYLNEPDRLYRRVRNENGELRLSKAAKAYNPGRGVYRSSFKNAQRLTRNENNIAYETSQYQKRQQQDFIVGIEIKTSPNHNPADDKGGISCINLQGKYPKDFDFTYKWHTSCLCSSFNILKTRAELDQDVDKILSGRKPDTKSKNEITRNPKSFTGYLQDNKDKWVNWKNPPRFLVNQ